MISYKLIRKLKEMEKKRSAKKCKLANWQRRDDIP